MTAADAKARRSVAGRKGAAARNAQRPEGRSVVAARYAHLHGCTLTDAALEFGISVASVSEAWRRIYPGQSAARSQRQPDNAGSWPEDEVTP